MYDFEKLGAFYLGKRVDVADGGSTDELVLYDSRDLTTHAVIIGMTGSGKTGLGIGLIEEAALDHIPVIAIDPKGDLGNLLLTFPDLAPDDFRPWINVRQATDAGQTPDEFARAQAALWKSGLARWGQDGERIAALRNSVDMAVYTPGSNAGLPVSVLKSFDAPPPGLAEDVDLYRDRVQATATGILSLLRMDSDPISSREHILLSQVLDHAWQRGRNLGLAELISEIQSPPMDRIGVMDIESFYPAKDRFALAMKLNNLLAAPGFEAWTEGQPLDTSALLYSDSGKPRVSVMSIAHLDDAERMFFVSMLLNDLIAWMRAQPGTSSLRAILYMDELFGFMPPVAEPPSKKLFLTLLKQARAYGLGLVLSTQNPVDLDYRGLSNTGTWFIGRLQTERDKDRVIDGLEGTGHGGAFDRSRMEQTIAGLGKRRFLLHNVHEDAPVVFETRWVMSYLAGPMTRDQIRALTPAGEDEPREAPPKAPAAGGSTRSGEAPVLPPSIEQLWVPAAGENIVYVPRLGAATDVAFTNARYHVDHRQQTTWLVDIGEGAASVDWDEAEPFALDLDALDHSPEPGATFADLPPSAARPGNYADWEKSLKRWIRQTQTITLYRSNEFKVTSESGESEGEFRTRLQQMASEKRDREIAKLRKRYASKVTTLENRLLRAEQAVERETQQSRQNTVDTAIAFGTAILGAVLGRKRLSTTSANRVGTAIRKAGRASKEAGDVERAKETAENVRARIEDLNAELEREIEALETAYDAQAEELREIPIRPKTTDIHVRQLALVWTPWRDVGDGRLQPVPEQDG